MVSILVFLSLIFSTETNPDSGGCLSQQEKELYNLIMAYRRTKKLPKVQLSASLTKVAQLHAEDLQNNRPSKGRCNMHSWSETTSWKRCCYTSDHRNPKCMWDKPRELTDYEGDGYEIAHWFSIGATPESALEGWKKSKGHNEVMINRGIWKQVEWNAIGIGIKDEYAVVWFGRETDPAGKPQICEE